MAADQRARQFVEFGHALHVADEDEEHAEGGAEKSARVFGNVHQREPEERRYALPYDTAKSCVY